MEYARVFKPFYKPQRRTFDYMVELPTHYWFYHSKGVLRTETQRRRGRVGIFFIRVDSCISWPICVLQCISVANSFVLYASVIHHLFTLKYPL